MRQGLWPVHITLLFDLYIGPQRLLCSTPESPPMLEGVACRANCIVDMPCAHLTVSESSACVVCEPQLAIGITGICGMHQMASDAARAIVCDAVRRATHHHGSAGVHQ